MIISHLSIFEDQVSKHHSSMFGNTKSLNAARDTSEVENRKEELEEFNRGRAGRARVGDTRWWWFRVSNQSK